MVQIEFVKGWVLPGGRQCPYRMRCAEGKASMKKNQIRTGCVPIDSRSPNEESQLKRRACEGEDGRRVRRN